MIFEKTNLNPTGKSTSDCVVRAIMKATNQTWSKVYNDLCELGSKMFAMPNDKKVYEVYLESLGWKKQRMPKDEFGFRYPIHKLADEFPRGIMIIHVAKHLTIVKDCILFDSWDCARACVGNYWIK